MQKPKLTKTLIEIIETAIESTNSSDRYIICAEMAEMLENRYIGLNFEYQLKRMNIDTTKKILNVIDIYLSKYAS